jgi:hypothetical protein
MMMKLSFVGCRSAWRIATSLPAALQNSHQNGGCVFLILVANPRTVRLCTIRTGGSDILIGGETAFLPVGPVISR